MSLSRSEQARINGAKSRGPKSPEGKARASMNALKHGRRSLIAHQSSLLALKPSLDAAIAQFAPQSAAESALLRQFAFIDSQIALWRAIESSILTRLCPASAPPASGPDLWAKLTAALEAHANESPMLPFVVRRIASLSAALNRILRLLPSRRSARPSTLPCPERPNARPFENFFSSHPHQIPSQPAHPKPLRPIPPSADEPNPRPVASTSLSRPSTPPNQPAAPSAPPTPPISSPRPPPPAPSADSKSTCSSSTKSPPSPVPSSPALTGRRRPTPVAGTIRWDSASAQEVERVEKIHR